VILLEFHDLHGQHAAAAKLCFKPSLWYTKGAHQSSCQAWDCVALHHEQHTSTRLAMSHLHLVLTLLQLSWLGSHKVFPCAEDVVPGQLAGAIGHSHWLQPGPSEALQRNKVVAVIQQPVQAQAAAANTNLRAA
jgi:hypothetical protein